MTTKSVLKGSSALCAAALVAALTWPGQALAGEVSLKSADGTVNLKGDLVSFEDNFYTIRTGLGALRISAERVRCEGANCPSFETATADVLIAGSDTVGLGMMPLLLEGYAGFLDAAATVTATAESGDFLTEMVADQGYGDPLQSYLVSVTNSTDAFTQLLDRSSEIAMAARRIQPAEARALAQAGAGDMTSPSQEHLVAVDSLVVITHPSNPVRSLTTAQLADIYSGRITNWRALGGPDAPIKVMDRAVDANARWQFMETLFDAAIPAPLSAAVVHEDNTQMATAVNADPHAIGFVSYAFQRGAKPVPLVNECGLTLEPDAFSARTEEYPLNRRLYLYSRADAVSEASRNLLAFATSPEADAVIAKSGFIDLGIDRREQKLDSPRAVALRQPGQPRQETEVAGTMLSQLAQYDRLSTTFRFATGSSRLDERGLVDLNRLTEFLAEQPEGTKVLVAGFTDSVGTFANNYGLSQRRAEQVAEALRQVAGNRIAHVSIATDGFGELAPVACNTNAEGLQINRRVEVWIETPDAG